MIALLPGLNARLDSTKCAMAPAGISRLEAPAAKPFGRGGAWLGSGPRALGLCTWISPVPNAATGICPTERWFPWCGVSLSDKPFAAGSPARTGRTAEAVGQPAVGIRNSQSVTSIVCPGTSTLERAAAVEVTETVAMEKTVVYIDRSAEPVRSPSPTAPSKSAKEASEVNTRAEPKSKAHFRVKQRRIKTIGGWSPHVCGIVDRNINHLRVGGLNFNRRLPTLPLACDGHLRIRLQSARLASLGSQPLHGIHDVGLLGEKCVPEICRPANV